MDSKIKKVCVWNQRDEFESYDEYLQILNCMKEKILSGKVKEVPVGEYYAGANLDEFWFKNEKSEIWRLVAPDAPFQGYWGPVN